MKIFKKFICYPLAWIFSFACCTHAYTQELPKVIKMVVPFAPGASNDLFARALAQKLSTKLELTVIVENRPGAGGVIGADFVAKAAPDGATLLFTSNALTTTAAVQRKLPYDPEKDLAPIAMVASSGLILLVRTDGPYTDTATLVQAMRDPKNKMTYGSSGIGSVNHVSTELLHSMAGTTALHLPYKGLSLALIDMIGGRVDFLITTVASSGSQLRAGKVKALGVTSLGRSPFNPELAPMADIVPGYSSEIWWGVFAPAATSKTIIERLNKEIRQVTAEPDMQKLFAQEAALATTLTAADFAQRIKTEIALWKKVVQERNIQPE
ncbi:tripartite tricarboxylate transporter substrate binding protein [Alcaligenaceae bacterium LF4-65]|uniref:Tripartite tricarboxylate transporter substrate binding protein n=1 Tax=Zwartia hollandica TaxID=324606 RepID=A0A953T446_9BURK|nr:tripartite tricarboxylate transporter substrate binding protein [Zwartia hollandica]MBZ1349402.1 tripartite tricarboxylate transporter substrate binding protein [Zwartia hollandica]